MYSCIPWYLWSISPSTYSICPSSSSFLIAAGIWHAIDTILQKQQLTTTKFYHLGIHNKNLFSACVHLKKLLPTHHWFSYRACKYKRATFVYVYKQMRGFKLCCFLTYPLVLKSYTFVCMCVYEHTYTHLERQR